MISVAEAEKIILEHLFSPSNKKIVLAHGNGKILAEKITADRDFPPFNRAAMDGIAISFKEFEKGIRTFPVETMQAAGQTQKTLVNKEACIEVMTGAPLPNGADTIIPYENIKIEDKIASILNEPVSKAQNVHRQGSDAKRKDVLLD